ncbi:MAG: hypothetical protein ACJ76F_14215 [Bacteroidia bacterium]
MKTFIKLLFILILGIKSGAAFAQSAKTPKQIADEKVAVCKEVENKYQVIVSNTRAKLALTSDLCDIVKKERKADKTTYYKYNDLITLKMYSDADLKTMKMPLEYVIYKEN